MCEDSIDTLVEDTSGLIILTTMLMETHIKVSGASLSTLGENTIDITDISDNSK